MSEQKSKAELLEEIKAERRDLDGVLKKIDPERMLAPELDADWSVKDTIAHITAWEGKMIGWLQTILSGETPELQPDWTDEDINRVNQGLYMGNIDKSLEQVLEEYKSSYQQSLELVESIPEADLVDPDRYEFRQGSPLMVLVQANTNWHYQEHRETLEAWLGSAA